MQAADAADVVEVVRYARARGLLTFADLVTKRCPLRPWIDSGRSLPHTTT
jgi:hypothetical protein